MIFGGQVGRQPLYHKQYSLPGGRDFDGATIVPLSATWPVLGACPTPALILGGQRSRSGPVQTIGSVSLNVSAPGPHRALGGTSAAYAAGHRSREPSRPGRLQLTEWTLNSPPSKEVL